MVYELALIVALLCVVAGVALLSVPFGLIVFGLLAGAYVLLRERAE